MLYRFSCVMTRRLAVPAASAAIIWTLLVPGSVGWCDDASPLPPAPPESGPGAPNYAHGSYAQSRFGSAESECWVLTPDEPAPESAPVVVFCHGWLEMHPDSYSAWLVHLARRGNVVIYPRFQASARTPAVLFTDNAASAVKMALLRLRRMGPVKPDLAKVALVGHSAGGVIAANLAAAWETYKLPRPRVLMCAQPGRSLDPDSDWGVPVADYAAIPADVLLLCMLGEDDHVAEPRMGLRILEGASRIPWENKNLVVAASDDHGNPPLVADHRFPSGQLGSGYQVNALDYYGCWKLLDGLTDAAFFGRNRQFALGDTPEQRYMGTWSDGTPVKELTVRAGQE